MQKHYLFTSKFQSSPIDILIETDNDYIIFTASTDRHFIGKYNLSGFNFCDSIQEVIDLTIFTLKGNNFNIQKIGDEELHFCIEYNLGFKKKIITIVLKTDSLKQHFELFKNEIYTKLQVYDQGFRLIYDEIRSLNRFYDQIFKMICDLEKPPSFNFNDVVSINYRNPSPTKIRDDSRQTPPSIKNGTQDSWTVSPRNSKRGRPPSEVQHKSGKRSV